MSEFSGKRVLVTGSTRGIGRAAAELFQAADAEVIIHGRSTADLAVRDEVRRLAASVGDLDVLVNCAGIHAERTIEESDQKFWNRMIEINVTAPWLLAQALLPGLIRRRGVIVNIASDAGLLGYPGNTVYCASKGAVIGLTRALAVEFAPSVRVNCVCPGPVRTDMMTSLGLNATEVETQWAALTYLGRVAGPVEIAEAILFAASARSSFFTGSLIVADGGATAGRNP